MNEFERGLRAARELSLKSISLHPKPILAYQQLVSGAKAVRFDGNSWKRFLGLEVQSRGVSNLEPRPDVLPYWRASMQVQPDNVIVREAYIDLLAPRWGGSVEALWHQALPTTHPGLSTDRQAHVSYSATMTIAYDHWFRKDFDGAVALLQAASKLCRLEQPFVDIGLIRLEQQRYAEVLAAATTAAELLPSSTPAALLRAHALRGLGRHTEAAPILLSLAPEGIPEVAYFLGEYHANGQGGFSVNPVEARRFFEIAARGGDRRAIQQLQSLPAAK